MLEYKKILNNFKLDVSDIELDKLVQYYENIIKVNKNLNIISNSTVKDLWVRHFIDSIQINKYLPDNIKNIFDYGSGGGFPGIPLAITNQQYNFYLVESNNKKSTFLLYIKHKLQLSNVTILDCRIESLVNKIDNKADLVVSRAMTNLDSLLELADPILKIGGYCMFFIGVSNLDLLEEKKYNNYDCCNIINSITCDNSKIIKLQKVK